MTNIILETRGLTKSFGAITAAANVNITVNEEEIVGVIGSNGAGKTTFINMVTGYLKPSSGSIYYRGQDITGLSPMQITRAGICRSFQVAQLFPELTTLENMLVAHSMSSKKRLGIQRPLKSKANIKSAIDALTGYGIENYGDSPVTTLPQGVRKLLDIAMAMVGSPALLLLDEPTSGVAIEEKFGLMDTVMDAVNRSGAANLFIEHDMEIISRYATSVIAFYDGRVIADGPTAEALSNPEVKEYIVGSELHRQQPERGEHAEN